MPAYDVSAQAENDLDQIAAYTKETWGAEQTDLYLTKLETGFELLANNPLIGRKCDFLTRGLHRFELGKHVIYYFPSADGVLIVRVLHQQMLPERSRFE